MSFDNEKKKAKKKHKKLRAMGSRLEIVGVTNRRIRSGDQGYNFSLFF